MPLRFPSSAPHETLDREFPARDFVTATVFTAPFVPRRAYTLLNTYFAPHWSKASSRWDPDARQLLDLVEVTCERQPEVLLLRSAIDCLHGSVRRKEWDAKP